MHLTCKGGDELGSRAIIVASLDGNDWFAGKLGEIDLQGRVAGAEAVDKGEELRGEGVFKGCFRIVGIREASGCIGDVQHDLGRRH